MPRPKKLKDPVRLPAMIERQTYQSLMSLSGKRSLVEGRVVSLAEYVRSILEKAVTPATKTTTDTLRDQFAEGGTK
jgi:hypothetical protein